MKRCIIVGAGDFFGLSPEDHEAAVSGDAMVIAADGGYEYLNKVNITPNTWIGDADSCTAGMPETSGFDRIKLPVEKDDTDTFSAVKYGLAEGCDEFHIYAGTGGRIDHTIANIRVMSYLAAAGKKSYLHGKDQILTMLENGTIFFDADQRGTVSVFSATDVSEGVSIKGLRYELEDAVLMGTDSVGVSNSFTGSAAKISVKKGRLLIVIPKDTHYRR